MFVNPWFYGLTIGWIAVLAVLFHFVYDEVAVTAVTTVTALVGLALALPSYLLLRKLGVIKPGGRDAKNH